MKPEESMSETPSLSTKTEANTKTAVIAGSVVILVAIAILFTLKSLQPTPPVSSKQEKAWSITAVKVTNTNAHPQLQLLGKTSSPFVSTLSAAVNADIIGIPAKEGLRVIAGQELILLDDREAAMNVSQREADVADLEAQIIAENNRHAQDLESLAQEKNLVALAEKAVSRETKLRKSNVTSEAKIDQSKQQLQQQKLSLQQRELTIRNHPTRLAQLEAKLNRAQSQLALAKLDLERTRIKAPFNGIITKMMASPGERVRIGETLVELYDSEQIEIRAQIPNRFLSEIRSTIDNNLTTDVIARTSSSKTIPVELSRIAGITNQGGGGVDAIFTVPENSGDIVIGQTLEILLELPEMKNVFLVPTAAIYGENRLYKVEEERLKAVHIEKVGQRFAGNKLQHIVISDDLKDGDTIATTQLANAISGLKVEIRN